VLAYMVMLAVVKPCAPLGQEANKGFLMCVKDAQMVAAGRGVLHTMARSK
jgi:hypothetical protein